MDDKSTLRSVARKYYMELYAKDNFIFPSFPLQNSFLDLNEVAI